MDRISRFFSISSSEWPLVLRLLVFAFGTGTGVAFTYALASSLFVEHFSVNEIPIGYIAGGVIGFVLSQLLRHAQSGKKSRLVSILTLSGVSFLLLSFLVLLALGYYVDMVVYALFVASIPIVLILNASINNAMVRAFDLDQLKRLGGLVYGGEILASIISFFSIPFLNNLFGHQDYLLLFATIGAFLALASFLSLKLSSGSAKSRLQIDTTEEKRAQGSFLQRTILLVLLSGTLAYIVNFEFLSVLQTAKSVHGEAWVLKFLATFFGIAQTIELITSMISGRVIKSIGISGGLKTIPLILSVFCSIALVVTIVGDFQIYFWMVVIIKLAERLFRNTLERPSLQAMYQVFRERRSKVQQLVDGQVQNLTSVAAGCLLLIITIVFHSQLAFSFNVMWFFLAISWLVLAFVVLRGFRKLLITITSSTKQKNTLGQYSSIKGELGGRMDNSFLVVRFDLLQQELENKHPVRRISVDLLVYLLEAELFLNEDERTGSIMSVLRREIVDQLSTYDDTDKPSDMKRESQLVNAYLSGDTETVVFTKELLKVQGSKDQLELLKRIGGILSAKGIDTIRLKRELRKKYSFRKILVRFISSDSLSPVLRATAIQVLGNNYVVKVPEVITDSLQNINPLIAEEASAVVDESISDDLKRKRRIFQLSSQLSVFDLSNWQVSGLLENPDSSAFQLRGPGFFRVRFANKYVHRLISKEILLVSEEDQILKLPDRS